jgi:GNAT superfamily N-acetyltransferase
MWVDPPYLRRGIGARLLAHAMETVRGLGGTELRVASDPNAEGFYRRMGARRVGEAPSTPPGRVLPLLIVDVARSAGPSPGSGGARPHRA